MINTHFRLKLKNGFKLYKDSDLSVVIDEVSKSADVYESALHTSARKIKGREVAYYIQELGGWVHDSDRRSGYSISRLDFSDNNLNYGQQIEGMRDVKDLVDGEWSELHKDCLCMDCA